MVKLYHNIKARWLVFRLSFYRFMWGAEAVPQAKPPLLVRFRNLLKLYRLRAYLWFKALPRKLFRLFLRLFFRLTFWFLYAVVIYCVYRYLKLDIYDYHLSCRYMFNVMDFLYHYLCANVINVVPFYESGHAIMPYPYLWYLWPYTISMIPTVGFLFTEIVFFWSQIEAHYGYFVEVFPSSTVIQFVLDFIWLSWYSHIYIFHIEQDLMHSDYIYRYVKFWSLRQSYCYFQFPNSDMFWDPIFGDRAGYCKCHPPFSFLAYNWYFPEHLENWYYIFDNFFYASARVEPGFSYLFWLLAAGFCWLSHSQIVLFLRLPFVYLGGWVELITKVDAFVDELGDWIFDSFLSSLSMLAVFLYIIAFFGLLFYLGAELFLNILLFFFRLKSFWLDRSNLVLVNAYYFGYILYCKRYFLWVWGQRLYLRWWYKHFLIRHWDEEIDELMGPKELVDPIHDFFDDEFDYVLLQWLAGGGHNISGAQGHHLFYRERVENFRPPTPVLETLVVPLLGSFCFIIILIFLSSFTYASLIISCCLFVIKYELYLMLMSRENEDYIDMYEDDNEEWCMFYDDITELTPDDEGLAVDTDDMVDAECWYFTEQSMVNDMLLYFFLPLLFSSFIIFAVTVTRIGRFIVEDYEDWCVTLFMWFIFCHAPNVFDHEWFLAIPFSKFMWFASIFDSWYDREFVQPIFSMHTFIKCEMHTTRRMTRKYFRMWMGKRFGKHPNVWKKVAKALRSYTIKFPYGMPRLYEFVDYVDGRKRRRKRWVKMRQWLRYDSYQRFKIRWKFTERVKKILDEWKKTKDYKEFKEGRAKGWW